MRHKIRIAHVTYGEAPVQIFTDTAYPIPEGEYILIPIAEYAAERNAIAKIGEAIQTYHNNFQTAAKQHENEPR